VPVTPSIGPGLPHARAARPPAVHIRRFDRKTRLMHIVIMVTFLGLSATGLPLLFSDAPWSRLLATLFGGFHGAGLVHRFFGATLLAAVVYHLANIFWRAFMRGGAGSSGGTSMVPQPRDACSWPSRSGGSRAGATALRAALLGEFDY
jgi:hypothetical protein